MSSRAFTLGVSAVLALACIVVPHTAAAARRVRPLFEPTDLDLEDPGALEADLQFGFARGEDAWRLIVPDFEIDIGLFDFLELDIDSAYALEGRSGAAFSIDHAAPDSLWLAAKLGFFDSRDDAEQTAFALGLQLGPKLPTASAAHGVGAEGLLLLGTKIERVLLVWNAGAFVDPSPDAASSRPLGFEVGVDSEIDLDAESKFGAIASAALTHFFSDDDDQLTGTLGMSWQVVDALQLSLIGLIGVLAGGDRFAILVGISPKLKLFG
jgi:hypothetical protein